MKRTELTEKIQNAPFISYGADNLELPGNGINRRLRMSYVIIITRSNNIISYIHIFIFFIFNSYIYNIRILQFILMELNNTVTHFAHNQQVDSIFFNL